mgnify:CR=1 FL=1
MKYYFVDLRALPISERIAACKKMEQYAWEVFEKVGTSGLESAGHRQRTLNLLLVFLKDANARFWETDLTSLWRRV